MSDVKSSRQARAAQTRARMLDAAYSCFCESGFQATTMAAIAARAGVAVQTLYFTFHTKDELFQAVLDRTVLGTDELPPPLQPWYARMTEAPTVTDAVQHLVTGVEAILARVAPILPAFTAVATEPAGQVWQNAEQLRLEGYRDIVGVLAAKAPLRKGLTRAKAADLMFVLLSPDVYRALVLGRAWSPAQWRAWLVQSLLHDLFGG